MIVHQIVMFFRSVFVKLHTYILNVFPGLYPFFELLTLVGGTITRLFAGVHTASNLDKCRRPKELIALYEYETCPFCKYVRECFTVLDLDHIVYPCPRETLSTNGYFKESRYRKHVKEEGGSVMFPYIEDVNTGTKMYESDKIVEYLWNTYGHQADPPILYTLANLSPFRVLSLAIASIFRPMMHMGVLRIESKIPEKPLELYGYEGSPYVKLVRETLCSLELPYVMRTMGRGSLQKRKQFYTDHEEELSKMGKRIGRIQVPYLKDPNTGLGMFESADIVDYLKRMYQTGKVKDDSWNYGNAVKAN